MFSEKQLGFIFIILSGACFGALGLFGKMAYKAQITSGELLALRYSLSALFTGLVILFTKRKTLFLKPNEIIISILLGAFGYAFFSSLFFMALRGLSASLSVLLLYTYPVIVAVMAHYFLKERLGKQGLIALIVAILGMVLLVWGEWAISHPTYLIYGFGSAFFYALYIIYSRKHLSHLPALSSSFYVQFGAGLILFFLNFSVSSLDRPLFILMNHYEMILSMAFICSFLAMTLFLAGLNRLTSSEASIMSITEPLFGVIIATIFLDEQMGFLKLVGGLFILVAMILISLNKKN